MLLASLRRTACLITAVSLITPAFAAPNTTHLRSSARAFTGHPCGKIIAPPTYAPRWPQDQAGFQAMSQKTGQKMEAVTRNAVQKSGRPIQLRWTRDQNTYLQYLYYAPYQGKPALGNVILVEFQNGKVYASSCELKMN